MSLIITIIGATGVQGGSVVDAALKSSIYKVRAITRNINSDKAKALAARGVELATADLNDEQSLIKAFDGSTAIYAVTDFFEPFAASNPEAAMEISNGKYPVPHFDAKAKIDDYIKSVPSLFAKTTFLWVTFYASVFKFPMYTPNLLKSSGKYVQLQPTPADVPMLSIGDAGVNVGIFALSILTQPQLTHGRYVRGSIESTTAGGFLEIFTKATGKPSAYVQTASLEEFDNVWPNWGREMGLMMMFFDEYRGEKAWVGEDYLTQKDLGITTGLVSIHDALKTTDWSFL
ncbi:NAD(P)-binding protein [Stipitochalara longipes BDJ]|nr:NAD(P)-binding protein [Stipitochalara longipes BDJ]